jgi:hypothetical protein
MLIDPANIPTRYQTAFPCQLLSILNYFLQISFGLLV